MLIIHDQDGNAYTAEDIMRIQEILRARKTDDGENLTQKVMHTLSELQSVSRTCQAELGNGPFAVEIWPGADAALAELPQLLLSLVEQIPPKG